MKYLLLLRIAVLLFWRKQGGGMFCFATASEEHHVEGGDGAMIMQTTSTLHDDSTGEEPPPPPPAVATNEERTLDNSFDNAQEYVHDVNQNEQQIQTQQESHQTDADTPPEDPANLNVDMAESEPPQEQEQQQSEPKDSPPLLVQIASASMARENLQRREVEAETRQEQQQQQHEMDAADTPVVDTNQQQHEYMKEQEHSTRAPGEEAHDMKENATPFAPDENSAYPGSTKNPHPQQEVPVTSPPQSRFSIEELQRLLVSLDDERDDNNSPNLDPSTNANAASAGSQTTTRTVGAATTTEDDRTLLDIFGQVAHEFLTKRVIPPTTAHCHWDWRSLQCEPACECHFEPALGDYHLGRSCRLRPRHHVSSSPAFDPAAANDDDDEHADGDNIDYQTASSTYPFLCGNSELAVSADTWNTFMDPAILIQQTALPRRVWWLLRRTGRGIRRRSQRLLQGLVVQSALHMSVLQTNVCQELWTLLYHQDNGGQQERTCWPRRQVPVATLPERLLCGPIHFPICPAPDTTSSSDEPYPRSQQEQQYYQQQHEPPVSRETTTEHTHTAATW